MENKIDHFRERLQHFKEELRSAIEENDNPQAAALMETSAEVIGGLHKAFVHFQEKFEKAWKENAE